VNVLLSGKRIIITGGASGIAAAAVRAFAREGAAVISLDINDEAGEAAAVEADSLGPASVIYRHCDVSQQDQVSEVFREGIELLGGLDVLAHLAAITAIKPAADFTEDDIQRIFDINVKGTIFTNQAAFPALREHGGAIINVASLAGVEGAPGLASYASTKGAVLGWTRSIAREWGRYGIRANAICPLIWTPMFDQHRATMTAEEVVAWDEMTAQKIPLGGKYGDPDQDMAPVMVFLASDMSRFITAQTLPIDGGWLILS
jgi:NAD(P)-dependent dehydrogenase (short-subunit alcohol dehydrogenase family)